jgi:chitin disaccharide deacetylase
MPSTIHLIVNADDFGLSLQTNRGIAFAHEHGIVTSASLMVRAAAVEDAVAYAKAHATLDLGLHVDLGEWRWDGDSWQPVYQVVENEDEDTVAAEVRKQVETFLRLCGKPPTHIDSHQHVHRDGPARDAVLAVAERFAIPVRHFTPSIRYCGEFYGQTAEGEPLPGNICVDRLVAIIAGLPAGTTELACHPGLDGGLAGMYRLERSEEVRALCDARVRTALVRCNVGLSRFSRGEWAAE